MSRTLVGFADPSGRALGFLVPLFATAGSNALQVQRVGADGEIIGFVELVYDGAIIYADRIEIAVGEQHVWAFAFDAVDLVIGRGRGGVSELLSRFDDLVAGHPMLAFEVAEFADATDLRLQAAMQTTMSLAELGGEVAATWRDLTVLTPDIRRALTKRIGGSEHPASKVVASVRDGAVTFKGLRRSLASTEEAELRDVTRGVLSQLIDLYGTRDWAWQLQPSRKEARSQPERGVGAVIFMDARDAEAADVLRKRSRWPVLAAPGSDVPLPIREAAEEGRIFIVARRSSLQAAEDALSDSGTSAATIISLEASLPEATRPPRGAGGAPNRSHRIIVPAANLPGGHGGPSSVATAVEEVVETTDRLGIRSFLQHAPSSAYLRSSGSGSDPVCDAWATLYDRLRSAGLSTRTGFCANVATDWQAGERRIGSRAASIMFPEWHLVEGPSPVARRSKRRVSMSALVPIVEAGPDAGEDDIHVADVVLTHLGWRTGRVRREAGVSLLDIEGVALDGASVLFKEAPSSRVRRTSAPPTDRGSLKAVSTLLIRPNATATVIVEELRTTGVLAVSYRDVCASDPTRGIWSFVGAQVRRLARGQLDRMRTLFMSCVLDVAIQAGADDLIDRAMLRDALASSSLGEELHLTWGRIREDAHAISAEVRLVSGDSSAFLSSARDVTAPFDVVVDADGVRLFR